ncbi:hypothetical protein AUK40_04075 [Candidatus Wirthbacteria bacterium CG2_30_54_11]|uniref:Glycosyl transferase family 1 domain-containing protein n=1 Tax=Candidatus Wirthbacteria bacterium CG2_30_54_11 TaxID=1817892 RepID=A0A1J5IXU4_9BACT|nr:MAG: hypothetical protein AUK40_04075 [Candidatus Wirthbacteria bacterium CG2_30_54_11]
MKIAIIADPIDEQYAGIHVYAREFIQALERNNQGHEIVYVHMRPNPFFDGMKELIIPLRRSVPGWSTIRKFFIMPWLFRKEKFDIVHDLSHIAPFTFWGGPYKRVITIHDLTPILYPEWHIVASRFVHKIIFPFIFRRADLVICDSEHTKEDVNAKYDVRGRIEAVLLAARSEVKQVDRVQAAEQLREKYSIEGDFLLYVGTLEPRKNLGLIIDVYEQLRQRGSFVGKLVLVGKTGWFQKEFHERLEQMDPAVRAGIILTGYVPDEDLSLFYSAAQLFLYPSFYEGFGLPPLEAMTCGCPVLVAENSSLPEVVGEGGLLLLTISRPRWVEAVERVLSDRTFRAKLSESALRVSKGFSWDRHVQSVVGMYEEIGVIPVKTGI